MSNFVILYYVALIVGSCLAAYLQNRTGLHDDLRADAGLASSRAFSAARARCGPSPSRRA
jgi:hypothetical protein